MFNTLLCTMTFKSSIFRSSCLSGRSPEKYGQSACSRGERSGDKRKSEMDLLNLLLCLPLLPLDRDKDEASNSCKGSEPKRELNVNSCLESSCNFS